MDINTFVRLAKIYSCMGSNIQEQMDDILDGNIEDTNPNAVEDILRLVKKVQDATGEGFQDLIDEMEEFIRDNKE